MELAAGDWIPSEASTRRMKQRREQKQGANWGCERWEEETGNPRRRWQAVGKSKPTFPFWKPSRSQRYRRSDRTCSGPNSELLVLAGKT
jgi:hypothetical protein